MSQTRGIVTHQLASIIDVIQMGRKSGLLTVERGDGMATTLERGEITFVDGHVTQARIGLRIGADVFHALSQWGTCRFKFMPAPTHHATPPSPQHIGAIPQAQSSQTRPLDIKGHYLRTPPTQRIPFYAPISEKTTESISPVTTSPQRIRSNEEAFYLLDQHRMSRAHRHLFLLIDGRRTTIELVRIMGREYEEVCHLLQELEQVGIIQLK